MTTSLPLSLGVQLAHAHVDALAEYRQVRVLFIKGPLATSQGLRQWKDSSDVDVLVDPEQFDALAEALQTNGWTPMPEPHLPWALGGENHSVTFIHPQWPCHIDAHRFFPGFLEDPANVFNELWADSQRLPLANRQIRAPSRNGALLVLALHALRHPSRTSSIRDLERLSTILGSMDAQQQDSVWQLARRTGAGQPILTFFSAATTPRVLQLEDCHPTQYRRWRLLASGREDRVAWWLVAFWEARNTDKPAILWRALFPNRRDLRAENPNGLLISISFRRLLHGLRAAPKAIPDARRARRRSVNPAEPSESEMK